MTNKRLPAEWESSQAVLMAWPHKGTDWAEMLPQVHRCYRNIINVITKECPVILIGPAEALPPDLPDKVILLSCPTNDTWTRDYGAIGIEDKGIRRFVDFKFNGWGLKFPADRDNLVNFGLEKSYNLWNNQLINELSFVLEGGSIESDGQGTILTTSRCLLSKNRNGGLSQQQIEQKLCDTLGANRVLWLHHGQISGDDTDSHIDTLARFASTDTIIFQGCQNPENPDFEELNLMKEELQCLRTYNNEPYRLFELPQPQPAFDEDGCPLPATYANFLILNKLVLVPSYGQPETDSKAAEIIAEAFPGREIISIDCHALIRQHGSLHCATMQLSGINLPK